MYCCTFCAWIIAKDLRVFFPSILFFQFGMILPNGGGQWWIFTNSIEGTILKYTRTKQHGYPVRVQMIQFCSRSTKLRKGEINWVNKCGKTLRPSIKHSWHYEKSKLSCVFSSEEHLLLTADWSHLFRSRRKRRTANLTTMNIRQMSAGMSARMINNWNTLESWKKERNRIFAKQYQCNTNTLINVFFIPIGFGTST